VKFVGYEIDTISHQPVIGNGLTMFVSQEKVILAFENNENFYIGAEAPNITRQSVKYCEVEFPMAVDSVHLKKHSFSSEYTVVIALEGCIKRTNLSLNKTVAWTTSIKFKAKITQYFAKFMNMIARNFKLKNKKRES
jgi:hypothetical protein